MTHARTALLVSLAAKWRPTFLDPVWCLEVDWSPGTVPHAGAAYVCDELLYAKIEAHPELPDDLLERVVVHELAELEVYEVGLRVEALAARMPPPEGERFLSEYRAALHRVIERRVARLLPGPRAVPVWAGDGFAPARPVPLPLGPLP